MRTSSNTTVAWRTTADIGRGMLRPVRSRVVIPPPPEKKAKARVWRALEFLQQDDFRQLARFTEHRLRRVGLPTSPAEDIVQNCLLMLAVGATDRVQGRHPRARDVENKAAFIRYLKGVIHSLVDGDRSRLENRYSHTPWDDDLSTAHQDNGVEFRDLADELFRETSLRAPPRLRDMLRAWKEQRFECDNIPLSGGHRRLRSELRSIVARVFRKLTKAA